MIHNITTIRSCLSAKTKIVSVVKANAYGHGQNIVAKILENHTDYFAVDDIEELRLLRTCTKKPTLVIGCVAKDELQEAVRLDGIICVYDIERLKILDAIGEKRRRNVSVHIKIDADLGRQGVLLKDLPHFIRELLLLRYITVDGVYTHFSNADDIVDQRHTQKQIEAFKNAHQMLFQAGFRKLLTHMSNTAGTLVYESVNNNLNHLVRIGLGLYGMWPSVAISEQLVACGIVLKPVMRWVTHVAQVKTVPKGYSIGYALTYITQKETKIAVIPQGYSDGYDRGLSNCGEVLIRGTRCKVLGRVAMNMFVVDVSHLDVVKSEDEVVLLGSQKNETISAEEIAEKINTINYEVTTRVSSLLPRVVV